MGDFRDYWNAYDEKEDRDEERVVWSSSSISKGIVKAAIKGIVSLIDKYPYKKFILKDLDEEVLINAEILNLSGLRITVLGTSNISKELPTTLIREIKAMSRESLCICILPSTEQSLWPFDLENKNYGATNVVPFYPNDMDALASESAGLLELIEYKLLRRLANDKVDFDTQYSARIYDDFLLTTKDAYRTLPLEPLNGLLDSQKEDYHQLIEHPFIPRVVQALERGKQCLLTGPSSSGKSVLARQVGENFLLSGYDVLYLNLGNIRGYPIGILRRLLLTADGADHMLFIFDDLQSNPSAAKYILALASVSQRICEFDPPKVLAVSWSDFAQEALQWFDNCLPLAIRPHHVRNRLIEQYREFISDETIDILIKRVGEDLFLLHLSLEQSKELKKCVELIEVAEEVWRKKTSNLRVSQPILIRMILVIGSLGQYDISVTRKFIQQEALVDDASIEEAHHSGLLRRRGDNFTLGHRSLCGLLIDLLTARGKWTELSQRSVRSATDVVLHYLKSLGSSLAVTSLRAMYESAGFKESLINKRAATIVEIWQTFNSIVERIEQQQLIDPTWSNSPASAMFAIQTFDEIGRPQAALKSLSFLRDHWRIENDKIKIKTDGFSTKEDFIQIQKNMIDEDEIERNMLPIFWKPAYEINIELFHKTWVLGLILCAEACAELPKIEITKLAAFAEEEQLPGSGAFYPARVPWCTARVLLGLAACGRTIDTSEAVKRAVSWLLKDAAEGGANIDGIWRSGTGSWNSTLETTSMVLLALAAVGYDDADDKLSRAKVLIQNNLDKWKAGKELDEALSIQSYLDTGGRWEDVANYTQQLSKWAHGEAFWGGARRSSEKSLEQSCRVAQIASHLIHIGWNAIRSDLPAFLEALSPPTSLHTISEKEKTFDRSSGGEVPQVEDVEIKITDPILESLQRLNRITLSECTVVGQYRRYDERVRNQLRDWHLRISNGLLKPTKGHHNFLIWASPGSGKSFFVQEIAHALEGKIEYFELNLARQSREDFSSDLEKVRTSAGASLCLIDEIDARAGETWPYEDCFSLLDMNLSGINPAVFILIGSSSAGLQGMVRQMAERSKGKDLLDRVFVDNRFEIPSLSLEDRLIIVASQVQSIAHKGGRDIKEIEKLACYYILKNMELQTPRQLSDLAVSAVSRLVSIDTRLKYDDLFYSGDRRNQLFWAEHQETAAELSDRYIRIA